METKGHFDAVVLAAGKGTRMKSEKAKVLHEVLGKPMVFYVLDAILALKPGKIAVVVGHLGDTVKDTISASYPRETASGQIEAIEQVEQKGTGHAVFQTLDVLSSGKRCLILNGDGPLIQSKTIEGLMMEATKQRADLAMLSFYTNNPFGYGRIVRDKNAFRRIVEEKEANEEEKRIRECNSGIYLVNTKLLKNALGNIMKSRPHGGEYYLTDIVAYAVKNGHQVIAIPCKDPEDCWGVNTIEELDHTADVLKRRGNR